MEQATEIRPESAAMTHPRDVLDDIEDISLRDYFAAQALAAVIDTSEDQLDEAEEFGTFALDCARRSFALADAMMIARDLEFLDAEEEIAADESGAVEMERRSD